MRYLCGLACWAGLVVPAAFGDGVYSGAGGAIPDNVPAGLMLTIQVPDSFVLEDVDLRLDGLTHTYAGDVSVVLEKVGGPVATIFHRIGQMTAPNSGDSSDFGGNYTFDVDVTRNFWTAAANAGPSAVIPSNIYMPSSALSGGANNFALDAFIGLDAAGEWRLTVRDWAGDDTGALGGWTLMLYGSPACNLCADSNCDGVISVGDIAFFVAAVSGGETGWISRFGDVTPTCDYMCVNDVNSDGVVSVGDIGVFVGATISATCGN